MTEKEAQNQCLMIKKTSNWLKKEIACTTKLLKEAQTDEEKLQHLNNLIYLRNKAGAEISRINGLIRRMEDEDFEF